MDAPIIAAMITGTAAIVGPIITYYVTKRKAESNSLVVEQLKNRQAVYEKAAALIREGKKILDTTWGSDEANLTSVERKASETYLDAKKSAMARDNTTYREIFTLTEDKYRKERFRDATSSSSSRPGYLAKLLTGINPTFPLIDFLVVDGEHVILSFLSSDAVRIGHQYLYIRSIAIAEHLTEYFDVCWQLASTPERVPD